MSAEASTGEQLKLPVTERAELNMSEVHNESVELLERMEDRSIEPTLAIAAMALTIGRLLSPASPMEIDDEVKFVQSAVDFFGAYFAGGGIQ